MLNLTGQERQVILFLASVCLIGTGINYVAKKNPAVKSLVIINQNIGKININKADEDTLMIIPGIGKKLAQRIIEYRNQNPSFTDIEDLKNIKGFKGYRFEKIKGMIYVE